MNKKMQVQAKDRSKTRASSISPQSGLLQRRSRKQEEPPTVPPIVHDVLNSSGQPLDAGTRAFMEPRFGHDFSRVRVHTDAKAAESARSANALAYTVGRNVVFGAGQCVPDTNEGRELIAHELTHVLQQSSVSKGGPTMIGSAEDHYEQEAKAVGLAINTLVPRASQSTSATPRPFSISRLPTDVGIVHIQRKKNLVEEVSVEDMRREFERFSQIINSKQGKKSQENKISGGIDSYISGIRPALIKRFLTFARIERFYQEEIVPASFLGQTVYVHTEMQKRLKAAENLIKKQGWDKIAGTGIVDIEGLRFGDIEVRANVNKKKTKGGEVNLSLHSFGLAVDINAAENPNVPNFPTELVKDFTGTDVFHDPAVADIYDVIHGKKKEKTDDLLKSVQVLTTASDSFRRVSRQALHDWESLRVKLVDYLQKQGARDARNEADRLIDLFRKWLEEHRAINKAYKKDAKARKKREEELVKKYKENIASRVAGTKATLHVSVQESEEVEKFLSAIGEAFVYTRDEQDKFGNIKAEVIGTPATIAAHGFINLPAQLITALIDKNGGGLVWLGAHIDEKKTKDFMHFEVEPFPDIFPKGDYPLPEDEERLA